MNDLILKCVDDADARIHAQLRGARVTASAVLCAVLLTLLGVPVGWAAPIPATWIYVWATSFSVTTIAASWAFRTYGAHSRVYAVSDSVTASIFCSLNTMFVVLLRSPHNFGWMMHLMFVLYSSQSPKHRRLYTALYIAVPTVAATAHALSGQWSMSVVAVIYGGLAYVLHGGLHRSAVESAMSQARTSHLEAEIRSLQLRAERSRIARDLHDGVSANLHALLWLVEQNDREPGMIAARLRETTEQLRDLVWGFSATEKSWDEWWADISARCRELCGNTMRVEFARRGLNTTSLSLNTQHALTNILLEATRNAVRHSGGELIRIALSLEGNALRVEIHDNGCGFPGTEPAKRGGGLANLRYRVRELGGHFEAENVDGARLKIVLFDSEGMGDSGAPRSTVGTA